MFFVLTRDPLGAGDEEAEAEDEGGRGAVVQSTDGALRLRLRELLLLQDGQVLADGGEHAHDARHQDVVSLSSRGSRSI